MRIFCRYTVYVCASLARDSKLIGFASEIKQGFNFFIFERERERESQRWCERGSTIRGTM